MSELQLLVLGELNQFQRKAVTLGKTSRMHIFTSSGTWTCPAPGTEVFALLIGGGGGGGTYITVQTPSSTAGGTSAFGNLAVAAGGTAGSHSNNAGTVYPTAGFFSFGTGGRGGSTYYGSVGKNGDVASFFGSVSEDVEVTVGAGGAVGSIYNGALPGTQGMVWVCWTE